MIDRMTTEEIESQYPDEWVLLGSPQTDRTRILGGVVLFHSKDRDEIHRFAQSIPPLEISPISLLGACRQTQSSFYECDLQSNPGSGVGQR